MKSLRDDVVDYLELRRSLGFKLKTDERLLGQFLDFMQRRRATRITSKLALAWRSSLNRPIRTILLSDCAPFGVLHVIAF